MKGKNRLAASVADRINRFGYSSSQSQEPLPRRGGRAGVSAEKSSLLNAGDLSQRSELLIIAPKEHFKN